MCLACKDTICTPAFDTIHVCCQVHTVVIHTQTDLAEVKHTHRTHIHTHTHRHDLANISLSHTHTHTHTHRDTHTHTHRDTHTHTTWPKSSRIQSREADLVEGAVLVILGEAVLLQEVVLQEAGSLQSDLVTFSQGILHQLITNQYRCYC